MDDPLGRKVTVNGVTLNVAEAGSGPPVLLLHGFPDSSRVWRRQTGALVDAGYRVIAPDLRGFGASERPAPDGDAYRFSTIVQDVVELLDAVDAPGRVRVVGHDFGAAVSWLLAMRHPERVARLAVLAVGHPGAFAELSPRQLQMSWYMFLFQLPIAEEWLRRDNWGLLRSWFHGAPDVDHYAADLAEPGALEAALAWYRANHVMPGTGPRQYPPVTAPVMGIWAEKDVALGEPQMTRSSAYVDGPWRYEKISEAGHWMQLEQPDAVNALLIDFLSG